MAKLTGYNIAVALVVALGGFSYGFIAGAFATCIGQPGFYIYFKLDPTSSYAASIIGGANGAFNGGAAFGALSQGWLADRAGRKKALFMSAALTLAGSALLAGSANTSMLIAVRTVQGLGIGMAICLGPLYLTEAAPPHRRGLLSGLAPMGFAVGLTLASWISVGTFYGPTMLQWRLPLALCVVPSICQLIGLVFIPESPRYLVLRDRNDEAWAVLRKIHHDRSDPAEAAAHAEYVQIVRQTEFDKTKANGYRAIITQPSLRKRVILAMFIQFACMSSGIQGILNYLVIIFGSLGLSPTLSLVLFGVYTTFGSLGVLFTIFVVDKIGRRRCFLIGFPALAICLLSEALLQWRYLGTTHEAGLAACILFMFLFNAAYQFVDAPSFAWVSEVFPTTVRAKGTSLAIFAFFVGNITYSTPSALAFRNIGYRMYLLYMGLCIMITIVVYFFIPETKLLPMEEIGVLFGDEVVVHLTEDGQNVVEEVEKGSKNGHDFVEEVGHVQNVAAK